jgi:hypothetical protein
MLDKVFVERLFKIGYYLVAHFVALDREIAVCGVFAPFLAVLAQVILQKN